MTLATSQGYLHYPPPAIRFTPPTSTPLLSNLSLPNQQSIVPLPNWFWPVLTTGSDLLSLTDPTVAVEVANAGNANNTEDSMSPIIITELGIDTGRPLQLTELQFPYSASPAPMDISPRPVHDDCFEHSTANDVSTSGREPSEEGEILESNDTVSGFGSPSRSHAHYHVCRPTGVGVPWDVGGSAAPPSSTTAAGYSNAILGRGSASVPIPIPASPAFRQESENGIAGPSVWPLSAILNSNAQVLDASGRTPAYQNFLPVGDYSSWELSSMSGWSRGQSVRSGTVSSGSSSSAPLLRPPQSAQGQQQQQHADSSVANVAITAAIAAASAAARAGAGMIGVSSAGLGSEAQLGVRKFRASVVSCMMQ